MECLCGCVGYVFKLEQLKKQDVFSLLLGTFSKMLHSPDTHAVPERQEATPDIPRVHEAGEFHVIVCVSKFYFYVWLRIHEAGELRAFTLRKAPICELL